MSASPIPSRASSTEYSDSELENVQLNDTQAAFATAFTLRDQPGLAGPVESIIPRENNDSSEYSNDEEDPFDVPVHEWETVFPDDTTRYGSSEEALQALQRWARDIGFKDKGKSLSKNKRTYYQEYGKSGVPDRRNKNQDLSKEKQRQSRSKKTDCKFRINVKRDGNRGDEPWIIVNKQSLHNHGPEKLSALARYRRQELDPKVIQRIIKMSTNGSSRQTI
jgi:hypothetical protein